ncbi:HAD family phosphatase [Segetibacter sp. 3557_3]|uniref:HAD family hydrolase n=1 Tax=Segetibacter sp. 3557_3 TaxID=2547429 RepID=UPI0010591F7E|nr:HAD family phosphatase [Segetibacter sp. 3557_3]TDH23985.1 HAD family phosphatase [Segetibacter sp. 3557_3]
MGKIKNIIFDMGGIFLGIDYKKTEQAFIDLGITDFNSFYSQHKASPLFEDLEMGKCTAEEFYEGFCSGTKSQLEAEKIQRAWNAMLGSFSHDTLEWLENIGKKYKIYLYSNTNIIHFEAFQRGFRELTGKKSFDDYFIKAYYSHTLGLRKPYPESYLKILELEGLNAEETLFIDDTPVNIEGAKKAGLQTILLQPPASVLDLDL